MRVVRITTNLPVADIEAAKGFYTGFLGLRHRAVHLRMGGALHRSRVGGTRAARDGRRDAPEDAAISVHTDDVEAAYREAQERGYEISHR